MFSSTLAVVALLKTGAWVSIMRLTPPDASLAVAAPLISNDCAPSDRLLVLPSVIPAATVSRMVWVVAPALASAPEKAASRRPYFSPALRPSAASKLPPLVAVTVVFRILSTPNRLLMAVAVSVTWVALRVAGLSGVPPRASWALV